MFTENAQQPPAESNLPTLRIVWRWPVFYLAFLFELMAAAVLPLNIYLIGQAINNLASRKLTLRYLLLFTLTSLAAAFIQYIRQRSQLSLRLKLNYQLSAALNQHLNRLPFWHFADPASLDVLGRAQEAARGGIYNYLNYRLTLIANLLRMLGLLYILASGHWLLALLFLLLTACVIFLDFKSISMMNAMFHGQTRAEREFGFYEKTFEDRSSLQYLHVIQGFTLLHSKLEQLARTMDQERKSTNIKAQKYSILSQILILVYFLGSLIFSILLAYQGNIQLGSLTAIISSLTAALAVSEQVSVSLSDLGESKVYFDEYKKLGSWTCEPEVAKHSEEEMARHIATTEQPLIEFRHVSFTYPEAEKASLCDVSFTIGKEERVALVGPNGSGKSTLIKLLLGLYRPDSGSILIYGKKRQDYSRAQLAALFSPVFQDYAEFALTVRENLNFAAPADLSEQQIQALLENVELSELQGKEDQMLGVLEKDGVELSRGQWQKVAIARGLANPNAFLIFDEPMSAQDPLAEKKLYDDLFSLMKQRGMLLISHRLGSARKANRILVLDQGQLCEDGSHEELMANNRLYASMFKEQQKWYV